jgi:ribosomal protein S27E
MSESQAERKEAMKELMRHITKGMMRGTCPHCEYGNILYGSASVRCDLCGKSPYPPRHASVKSEDV